MNYKIKVKNFGIKLEVVLAKLTQNAARLYSSINSYTTEEEK
jgi:hypothetical protein